ncbi:MAG: phosphoribosylanthranilate isomerase [Chloroflexota bacterium]|nr:phosphoribosylanthranilate isomerase [Anaerolineae bacterium]HMM27693.1 phosphoribosylanthranilate isomerase [Aggregatilineaceae bacterium]
MTRVKVCGVTTLGDALACAGAGVDLIGLNFYAGSPRCVTVEAARAIADGLRAALGERRPLLVGVFVNAAADEIAGVIDSVGLDAAQLSGDEPPATLRALDGRGIKALRPRNPVEAAALTDSFGAYACADERLPALVVDAYHPALYGGTGVSASLEVARAVLERAPRVMLAGGLAPGNVGERVRAIRPWGVDVASGVENGAPGVKDLARVRAFVAAVRAADAGQGE